MSLYLEYNSSILEAKALSITDQLCSSINSLIPFYRLLSIKRLHKYHDSYNRTIDLHIAYASSISAFFLQQITPSIRKIIKTQINRIITITKDLKFLIKIKKNESEQT